MDTSVHRLTGHRMADPLGLIATLAGLVGAGSSFVLWLYQSNPRNPLIGSYAYEVTHGGPLRDNLIALALAMGILTIAASLLDVLGSARIRSQVPYGLILGLLALSYPLSAMLHVVQVPLKPVFG